jgi:hypothetical protein
MLKTLFAVLVTLPAIFPAAAGAGTTAWEGVIDSKMTAQGGQHGMSGTGKMYVSKLGIRTEMEMGEGPASMKMTTLTLKSKPGFSYMVNDAKKTYSEIDTTTEQPSKEDQEKLSVKRLGSERVAGHDCAHALITGEKGDEWEVWSTKDMAGAEILWASMEKSAARRGKYGGLYKTMKDAGLDGWPMKWLMKPKDGSTGATWEVTGLEEKSVPASLFDLSKYKKSEGPAGAMGQMQLSPEQQKKLDEGLRSQQEALKKMTPEQRKKYEDMMKSMKEAPGEQPKAKQPAH